MVERRVCTFCGDEIEPGTGRMFIKKDGVVFHFCSSKCYKNLVQLGRVPRRTTWTRYYEREKEVRMKGAPEAPAPKARKVKKAEEKPEAKDKGKEKPVEKKAEPEKPKPVKKAEAPKKEAAPKTEKKPVPKKTEHAKKEAEKPKAEEAKE